MPPSAHLKELIACRRWLPRFRLVWCAGYVCALALVALVSLAISLLIKQTDMSNVSMLYLIAVLATATVFGRGPAILASVSAFLTFNWLFIEPLHTWTVADTEQWVSLLLFLLTATVTGQLAAGQRRRAIQAAQREREAVLLYDVARLMSDPCLDAALRAVAERLRGELQLSGVAILLDDNARLKACAEVGEVGALLCGQTPLATAGQLLAEGPGPTASRPSGSGRWIRIIPPNAKASGSKGVEGRLRVVPMKVQDRREGLIVLVYPRGPIGSRDADSRLLSAVAAQLAQAVERSRLRREVTDAEVLRRTDELKTALLGTVSHQLRTPLASILAASGSLLQQDVEWSSEERREFAETISQEACRLNQLINNILDLSRIQGGSLHPEKSWYDLGALVDDVLARLRQETSQHPITAEIPEDLPPVPLDYVLISQVLSNLVENAVHYTPPGTQIRISVQERDDEVQVEVADRGPGIPRTAIDHLFEPFYRLNGSDSTRKGTGLGLAIARGLVEAHGGRIWAENRPEGGASFIFRLPLIMSQEVPEGDHEL